MSFKIMHSPVIYFPRPLINQILHEAQRSPEREVCGLVAAIHQQPCRIYPVDNASETPETRFIMDTRQQLDAVTAMRGRGETPYAIYHSHPGSAAIPSMHDIREHAHPELLHLIITLNTKGVLEIRAFRLDHERATEYPLKLDGPNV